jgi:hypoxanthine phosphoribosyltransferase
VTDQYIEVVNEVDLRRRVAQLGTEIARDYEARSPILIGILTGCMPFIADLSRQIDLELSIDFLSLTRFGEDGRVGIALDLSLPVAGEDVIIVEDIVDTGLTLTSLRRIIEMHEARSVATVALLDKAARRIVDVAVEYRGFEVGDEFLLGYGLDWEGRFRNLRSLWAVMDMAALRDHPGEFSMERFRAPLPAGVGSGR